MNEKQIKQALQEIAATHVTEDVDLWPQIERKIKRSPRFPVWEWSLRLAGTAAMAVILLLFATWFLSLRQPIATEVATLPENTPAALSPLSFTIDTELVYPPAPATLPQYQVAVTEPPQTEEGILAWAVDFGLPNPKLFWVSIK